MQNWAELKLQELMEKGRQNWDVQDCEAYAYCKECEAEDQAELDYLGNWDIYY